MSDARVLRDGEEFPDNEPDVPIPQEIQVRGEKRRRDDEDEFRPLGLRRYRRNDRRIPRFELPSYENSAFSKLFKSGDDQKLLNCCGVDHKVFSELLDMFEPVYNSYGYDKNGKIKKRMLTKHGKPMGRKREVDATGALGLVLHWYRTRGPITRAFAAGWGMTATPMFTWLKFSRQVLLQVIQHHPKAKVSPPTDAEVEQSVAAISAKYPAFEELKVWGAVGQVKVHLQPTANFCNQNDYYVDSAGDGMCIKNLFIFDSNRRIRKSILNAPGAWDETDMSGYGIYQKLEDVYERLGGRVVVDSNVDSDFEGEHEDMVIRRPEPVDANNEESYIQTLFPRLKDTIGLDEFRERMVILKLMGHLYNYQTATLGRKLEQLPETANDIFNTNNN